MNQAEFNYELEKMRLEREEWKKRAIEAQNKLLKYEAINDDITVFLKRIQELRDVTK